MTELKKCSDCSFSFKWKGTLLCKNPVSWMDEIKYLHEPYHLGFESGTHNCMPCEVVRIEKAKCGREAKFFEER